MASTFDNGMRQGRTEATLEDVRTDIRKLEKKFDGFTEALHGRCRVESERVSTNAALITVGMILVVPALGFLYVALIRGWF